MNLETIDDVEASVPSEDIAARSSVLDALHIDGRAPRESGLGARGVNVATRARPVLSWRVDAAVQQHTFDVRVDDETGRTVWSSGVVTSQTPKVRVEAELVSNARHHWAVRIGTIDGAWSLWHESDFETGPAAFEDWHADWVSAPARTRLRQSFTIDHPVAHARLHLTGQGLVRAEIDGIAVNAGHLDPTRTDAGRALYRTYDVDDLLAVGRHHLDLVLGSGEWERTGLDPRVLAELVIRHTDGTASRVFPDASCLASPSRVVVDEPFYLERHDTTAEQRDQWTVVASSAFHSPVPDAVGVQLPPVRIDADPTPPVRVVNVIRPTEIGRREDVRLYDVGTNIAGRTRTTITDPVQAGTVVQVVHGEQLDIDGRLDTTNLMMPFDHGRERQVVELIASGAPGEVVEPWFAYYGFRYFEIHGLPADAAVEVAVQVVHTDLEASGSVTTDNELISTLMERAERTLLNNVHGVPEDCPTREQSAWTGDTASVAEYELAAFDSATFIGKWIRDLVTSQAPDGSLPAVAPDVREQRLPADPVWGSALHRLLLGHWLHYGDEELVVEVLPALRAWADFQLACVDGTGIVGGSPISYGHDWLALEQTPPPLHHTGATIDCLLALARLEDDLGSTTSAATRRAQVDALRRAAEAHFFDRETGVVANGSQAAYAIAVDAGILTGAAAEEAVRRIELDVRRRGNRLSGGFATTRTIVRVLAASGRSNVIVDMLQQPLEPGIGAMLVTGPGTFWECWWIDPTNTGTGSLDHVGLGGVFAGWVWESLAGLTPLSSGYGTFLVAPQFVVGIDRLSTRTTMPAGEVLVSYVIEGGSAAITIEVPSGASAVLRLPGVPERRLDAGRHRAVAAVTRPALHHPAPDIDVWSAPSIAPRSADVTGRDDLLGTAITTAALSAGDSTSVEVLPGLNCMPIPHAQTGRAVVEVLPLVHGTTPIARIDLADPLDAGSAQFVYALVDLCSERSVRGARPTIDVISADGSRITASAASWPAGWNRVAVDVGHWPGRTSIGAIEVSIGVDDDAEDVLMPEGDARSLLGFHLGEVGMSSATRTW